ncbi:MAG: hypothetical protein JWM89_49 [Acidimicrobiales bacterium]|nr:hypothetical protein [Acidimicrobiales bacterium]
MLILLIQGLSAGVDSRVVVYEQHSHAQFFVAQPGTTSFLGATSVVPKATEAEVRRQPGVTWTAAVRGFFTVPEVGGTRVPSYVVGWTPGERGGPWAIGKGRAPAADDEVAIGRGFASRTGLGPGDAVELLGRSFEVVGLADDADMFMASFIFMTHDATDTLLHQPATTSFVLVGSSDPPATAAALHTAGLHALTTEQIGANDLGLKGQAYSAALGFVVALAFGVGMLVIALTIYAAVTEHARDFGIIKAIGARPARLYRLVLTQSLVLTTAGLGAGALFFWVGRRALTSLRPQFAITVTAHSVGIVLLLAIVMALAATALPARRLAAVEPAAAFR